MLGTHLKQDVVVHDCKSYVPQPILAALVGRINKSRVKAKLEPVHEDNIQFIAHATIYFSYTSNYGQSPDNLRDRIAKIKSLPWTDLFDVSNFDLTHIGFDSRRPHTTHVNLSSLNPGAVKSIIVGAESQCREYITALLEELNNDLNKAIKLEAERTEREILFQKRRAEEEVRSKQQAIERMPEDIARSLYLPRATTELMIDLIRSVQNSETIPQEDKSNIIAKFKEIAKAQKAYHDIKHEVIREMMPMMDPYHHSFYGRR